MIQIDHYGKLVERALASETRDDFHRIVSPLLDAYEILSFGIGRSSTHWRARIIDDRRYDLLEEIDYPPKNLVRRAGRLNNVGESFFYVSSTVETAVAEVLPREGQLVQVAGFRIAPDEMMRFICLGEYQSVYKRGYTAFNGTDPENTLGKIVSKMTLEERQVCLLIDNFLAHVISDKEARNKGYLHSRALRDLLFDRISDADAIAFPSARDSGGMNFGVKPEPSDRLYQNVCCIVVQVGKFRRFCPIELNLVGVSEGVISEENRFSWSPDDNPKDFVMYNMTKQEFEQQSL